MGPELGYLNPHQGPANRSTGILARCDFPFRDVFDVFQQVPSLALHANDSRRAFFDGR
jgi:outer membrane lipopolysaccharide assembly protein LptE/RlpB